MSRLVKNSIYYTVGNIISKTVPFILLPIYTKYLTPDQYGIVNSMQVLTNILLILFTFGLERSLYRLFYDYNQNIETQKIFLGTMFLSILALSTLMLLLIYILQNPISSVYKSIEFYPFYSIAIFTAFFSTFSMIPKIYYQITEKAEVFILISFLQLFLNASFIILEVVIFENGAKGMLRGTLFAQIVLIPLYIILFRNKITIKFNFSIFKKCFFFSLPMIPALISTWVINMSDRIFLERYFSTYEVGIYSFGYKIGQLILVFSTGLLKAYNPYFYKIANSKIIEDPKKKLYQTNNIIILIILFLVLSISLFSKDLIILFFNEKYHASSEIVPLISIGYFFISLNSLQNFSFYQNKNTKVIMYLTFVSSVVNLGLNFLLIPKYSSNGAALATLLTQVFFFIVLYFSAKKFYFIPYNWLFILPILILTIPLVIVFNYILDYNFLLSFVKFLIFMGLIIFFVYKFKIVQFIKHLK